MRCCGRQQSEEPSEEKGGEEQNIDCYQNDTPKSSLQSREQIDRSSDYNQAFYRFDDPGVVVSIPIRNGTCKEKIGERKEVMMSIVVVRQEVRSAVDKHTPSDNRHPLGMQSENTQSRTQSESAGQR